MTLLLLLLFLLVGGILYIVSRTGGVLMKTADGQVISKWKLKVRCGICLFYSHSNA